MRFQLEVDPVLSLSFTATHSAGFSNGSVTWNLQAGGAPTGVLSTPLTSSVLPPFSVAEARISGNPFSGIFAASAPAGMPIHGFLTLRGFTFFTLHRVPLRIGTSGTEKTLLSGIGMTAIGQAWTTKTASLALTTVFPTPTPNGPSVLTAMGLNQLGPLGGGTVVLVTAMNIVSSLQGQLPTFATLTLQYVPEPTTAVLLAGSGAALGLAMRREARRRKAPRS